MGRFTRIPQNTFSELQMDAGLVLNKFDPTGATPVQEEDIITATTGGVNPVCEPTYSDLGEDVDNCPNNMKELKHLDGWNCTLGFTALGTSPASIKLSLGAADIDGTNTSLIKPRKDLQQSDFSDVWWVGDRADGGFVAIRLRNALSTGGFSLQTTKNGKGQNTMTLTGHVSINDQETMPMEFYSVDPDGVVSPEIEIDKHAATIEENGTVQLTTVAKIPSTATVSYTSSNAEIATVSDTGLVTAVAEGNAIITAKITVDGVDYTDTCTIVVMATA